MKFLTAFIAIAFISFLSGIYFPWWSVSIVAFAVSFFIKQRPVVAFFCGFTSILVLWIGLSFWMSLNNDHILAQKLSLLVFKKDKPWLIFLLTGFLGGLVAGVSAFSASLLFKKSKEAI